MNVFTARLIIFILLSCGLSHVAELISIELKTVDRAKDRRAGKYVCKTYSDD